MNEAEKSLLLAVAKTVSNRLQAEHLSVATAAKAAGSGLPDEVKTMLSLKFNELVGLEVAIKAVESGVEKIDGKLREEVQTEIMLRMADFQEQWGSIVEE